MLVKKYERFFTLKPPTRSVADPAKRDSQVTHTFAVPQLHGHVPRTQLHFLYRRSRQVSSTSDSMPATIASSSNLRRWRRVYQPRRFIRSSAHASQHVAFADCSPPPAVVAERAAVRSADSSSASLSSILMRFICVHHNIVCVSTSCPLLCLLYSRQPVRPFFRCLLHLPRGAS